VLVVADDGPGIPVRDHATVFQRFTRLDDARSREAGGSGLGLAIVHDIVARHGGTIAITSSDGDGARFVVTLPRID
jgi:signal transduction histidine kinase